MSRARPLSEIKDGWPIWTVDCDDPQAAQEVPAELHLRRLAMPDGELLVLALRLFDVKGRPQLHHLAGPLDRPEVAAWAKALRQRGGVGLLLERRGWATVYERHVKAAPAELLTMDLPLTPGRDPEAAIQVYLERYRVELPRLHQPEAVWDAMLSPASAPAPASSRAWLWALLALAAGAAAWLLLH